MLRRLRRLILRGRALPEPLRLAPLAERREMEKVYARLFSSPDGQRVLSHLQHITLLRSYGADAADEQIRHAEGQRALVANIMRLIEAGRTKS